MEFCENVVLAAMTATRSPNSSEYPVSFDSIHSDSTADKTSRLQASWKRKIARTAGASDENPGSTRKVILSGASYFVSDLILAFDP